jgi:uridylate kinase
MSYRETIVMSVGGSLIVPDGIDTIFLQSLKSFVEEEVAEGKRIVIIAGGGQTARRYQKAADTVGKVSSGDLDWLGLHATRLNGQLLRTIFSHLAYPVVVTNPDEVLDVSSDKPLIIAAGYRPGASTDLRAVQIAHHLKAHKVINLSDTDYVYTDNPKTNPEAIPLLEISWADFRKLIPSEWGPGLSSPFDPIAAKEAEQGGVEVAQIAGTRLEEVAKYLGGEKFIGTRIF